MNTIDTNVLLRVLIDDLENKQQSELARECVATIKQLYITQVVQVEMVWVLKHAYKFLKERIVFILENLALNGAIELQNRKIYLKALAYYTLNNIDFADAIILAEAEELKATPLLTFDKKLSKLENAELVSKVFENV